MRSTAGTAARDAAPRTAPPPPESQDSRDPAAVTETPRPCVDFLQQLLHDQAANPGSKDTLLALLERRTRRAPGLKDASEAVQRQIVWVYDIENFLRLWSDTCAFCVLDPGPGSGEEKARKVRHSTARCPVHQGGPHAAHLLQLVKGAYRSSGWDKFGGCYNCGAPQYFCTGRFRWDPAKEGFYPFNDPASGGCTYYGTLFAVLALGLCFPTVRAAIAKDVASVERSLASGGLRVGALDMATVFAWMGLKVHVGVHFEMWNMARFLVVVSDMVLRAADPELLRHRDWDTRLVRRARDRATLHVRTAGVDTPYPAKAAPGWEGGAGS